MTRTEIDNHAKAFNTKLKKHPSSDVELIQVLSDFAEELFENSKSNKIKELLEYNNWLMEVWCPNQLNIPFSINSPKAFIEYKEQQSK